MNNQWMSFKILTSVIVCMLFALLHPLPAFAALDDAEAPLCASSLGVDSSSVGGLVDSGAMEDVAISSDSAEQSDGIYFLEDADSSLAKEEEAGAVRTSALSVDGSGATSGGIQAGVKSGSTYPDKFVKSSGASYAIPIEIPPGRQGVRPSLQLTYNSHRGNGWIGVGWDLGLGCIRRSLKKGLSTDAGGYVGDEYVFEKDGGTIELTESWMSCSGCGQYGARIENPSGFTRFEKSGDSWVAETRDGKTLYFGTTTGSRQGYGAKDFDHTFQWNLDKVQDSNGNYWTISYVSNSSQLYPQRIEYTKHTGTSGLDINEVVFYLEDRSDDIPSYAPRFSVTTAKRLKTIEVRSNGVCVRACSLNYGDASDRTGRSLLRSVTLYGDDAVVNSSTGAVTAGTALPPISLAYQDPAFGAVRTSSQRSWSATDPYQAGYGDFNGDGMTDFMYRVAGTQNFNMMLSTGASFTNSVWRHGVNAAATNPYEGGVGDFDGDGLTDYVFRMSASGDFHLLRSGETGFLEEEYWGHRTYPVVTAAPLYGFGDFNGDGRLDYYYFRASLGYIYVLASMENGGWASDYFPWYGSTPPAIARPLQYFVADFTGDGKDDLCYRTTAGTFVVFVSTGSGFQLQNWTPGYTVGAMETEPAERGVGDFNGDGLADYMYKADNTNDLYVLLSTGSSFVKQLWLQRGHGVPDSPYQGGFGDFNNDGLTDYMCKITHNTMGVAFSTGSSFLAPQYWGLTVGGGQDSIGDFNGDGLADYSVRIGSNYYYVYTTYSTGDAPDLMASVDNGKGAEVSFGYEPSSKRDNKVAVDGNYEYLPFVVQTVVSVTVDAGIDDPFTTLYDYAGGYYDKEEREFRGFGAIAKTNPDGTVFTTYTEVVDDWIKGRVLSQTLAADSTLLSKITQDWNSTGSDDWRFVHPTSVRSESYDSAGATWSQEDYTYEFTDDTLYGLMKRRVNSGSAGPSLRTSFGWENVSTSGYVVRQTYEKLEALSGSPAAWTQASRTDFDYEANTGNLLEKTSWLATGDDPVTEYAYDAYGNLISETDALDHTSTLSYETTAHTFPATQTNALGHVTSYSGYDYRYGKALTVTDPNGNSTATQLDHFGRTTLVFYPDGGRTGTTYYDSVFPRYSVTSTKHSMGVFGYSYTYYDGLGRDIQSLSTGQTGFVATQKSYDEMGREKRIDGPFQWASATYPATPPALRPYSENHYDDRGRITSVTTPDSTGAAHSTSVAYSGLSTTVTDLDGGKKTETRDYLGRVLQVIEDPDNLAYTTDYSYDALGNLTSITDHYGNQTTFAYDTLGRKTSMTDPDMGTWTYQYDANNNLVSQTDAKNQTTTFTHDALNRLTLKQTVGQPGWIGYMYDPSSENCPNGIGRLWFSYNGVVSEIVEQYDSMGRILRDFKQIDAPGGDGYKEFSYTYNLAGNPLTITYPDNTPYTVGYTYYPGTSLVHEVTGYDGQNTVVHAELSDYEPTGKPGFVDFANDAYSNYEYNASTTRLMSIQTVVSDTLAQEFDYTYTDAGNVASIADQQRGKTYTYAYDALHRLLSETCPGAVDNMALTYDAIGNILTKSVGSDTLSYGYASNGSGNTHRMETVTANGVPYTMTYDANGNMTSVWDVTDSSSVISRTVSFNAQNMPSAVSVSGGQHVSQFSYDGNGRRVFKSVTENGNPVGSASYYKDSYEVRDGVPTKYIFAGNMRIAKVTGANTYYLHQDHLGSSTIVSPVSGSVEESNDYRPFGQQRYSPEISLADYRYTDQEWDSGTGLYNYDARLYDPVLGRFISADSILPDYTDPQQLNPYAYCRNNPLRYVDPSGNESVDETITAGIENQIAHNNYVSAYLLCVLQQGWTYFGMESLSQVVDGIVSDDKKVKGSDVFWATVDVATLGKGGGIVVGGEKLAGKYGGKILGKSLSHVDEAAELGEGIVKYGNEAVEMVSKRATEQPRDAFGRFMSKSGDEVVPGSVAEQSVWDAIKQKSGWQVVEGRVSVRDASGQLRVYDGVAISPSGKGIGLEVKSGSSMRTVAQSVFDSTLNGSRSNIAAGVGQSRGIVVNRSIVIRR